MMNTTALTKEEERYEGLIADFIKAGFTKKQAAFIISLLHQYLPVY